MRPNPKFQFLKNMKARALAIMLGLAIFYVGVFYLVQYQQSHALLEQEQQSVREEVGRLFSAEIVQQVGFFRTRLKCHLASPDLQKALQNRDRAALLAVSAPKFAILQQHNPFVTHMQFYAPDGSSLLRVHEPEVFGDKISELRPMVAYAVKHQTATAGFEQGHAGYAYRVIEPAFNANGEYIGSVEFGFQPAHFEKALKDRFSDLKLVMFVAKEPFGALRVPFHSLHSLPREAIQVLGEDQALLHTFISNYPALSDDALVQINGDQYLLISGLTLEDFQGDAFVEFVLFKNMQKLNEVFYKELWQAAFIGLFLLLMTWLAAEFSLSYFVKRVYGLTKELAESHAKMDAVFQRSREGIAIFDASGCFVSVNPACAERLGYDSEALVGMAFTDFMKTSEAGQFKLLTEEVLQDGFVETKELCVFSRRGTRRLFQFSLALLPDEGHILMISRDISRLRTQQKELERYMNTLDENVIASKTDLAGYITYASQAFCEISGYSKEELIGKKHSVVRHPDMPASVYRSMWETINSGRVWRGELKNLRKDGSCYWVSAIIGPELNDMNEVVGYTAIRHDITDKKRVEALSVTDELTGLYNRRYYNEVFERELNRRQRDGLPFLFVLMDIDNFKAYNDCYGHQAGDEALIKVSRALSNCFQRTGDCLFRLGGEEFGAILNVDSRAAAEQALARVHRCVAELELPHEKNPPYGVLTLSVGAYLETEYRKKRTETAIYLLADKALYEAKHEGRSRSVLKVNGLTD